jgi:hypothetical protein
MVAAITTHPFLGYAMNISEHEETLLIWVNLAFAIAVVTLFAGVWWTTG